MKRYLLKAAVLIAGLLFSITLLLYLTRTNPVILTLPLDDTIRPRTYCLLNPFRDKSAERIAESYLHELREGNVAAIAPFVDTRDYVLDNERKWPIRKWQVGSFNYQNGKYEIRYWVSRGNGYLGKEEVSFWIEQTSDGLKLKTYSAIY